MKAAKSGNWEALEDFPFAEAVVCLGFFAVYLLEELGGFLMGHGEKKADHQHHKKTKKHPAEEDQHKLSDRNNRTPDSNGHAVTIITPGSDLEESRSRSSSESTVVQADSTSNIHRPEEAGHHHSHGPVLSDLKQKSVAAAIRGFLLVFALSFHSVFEGMAIGLQTSVKVFHDEIVIASPSFPRHHIDFDILHVPVS